MSTVAEVRAAEGPRLLDPEHPWPGLEAYDERCSEYFSGRTAEADELLRRILDEPLTVLYGKSGLGKTSLLKAGLFPRLRAVDRLPLLVRLQPRAGAPPLIEQVFQALLTQLANSQIDFKPRDGSETLWEFLHRKDQEFWTPKNRLVEPIFVFDQFEELFTLGTVVSDEVASFRGDLADLAENRVPARVAERIAHNEDLESRLDLHHRPCHLVITLREDFLADLESWRPLMPSLRRNRMRLLPMTREQAKSAVVNDHTSHLVPDAIGERILDFLSSSSTVAAESSSDPIGTVEPALLSLFCRELNERRLQEQKPVFDGDLIEGGKDSIVSEFYENAVKGRPAHVRRFVEEELVTENGYRNSCAEDDAEMQHQVSRSDIDALVNLHLLRREHHLGVERVELTHDLLTRAIAEARTARRQKEQADEAKQVLVRQIKRGGLAVACAVLGVFAALGWAAWSARALSESRELVGFARARLESDAALSMALALEAMKRHDTPEARGVLLEAARYKWPTLAISYDQVGGVPARVALDRRGGRLAVAAFGAKDQTTVTIWNLDEGDRPAQLPNVTCQVQGQASFLAFSPDESYVAIGAADGVRRLDLAPGPCTLLVESPVGGDSPISFSHDGRVLAWRTEGVASRNPKFIVPEKIAILELGPPQVLTAVEPGYGASFSLVGDDALLWVNLSTRPTLLVRDGPGQWNARDLPAPECGHLQAAFPGPRFFTTNWTGGTCLSQLRPSSRAGAAAAGSKAVASEPPDVKDARLGYRYMEDAIWSTDGRTVAELLPLRELVLRTFGAGPTIESRLRGEPEIQELPSQIGTMVAISSSGTRVAMLDAGGDHHELKVFSLGAAKPLMTAFPAKAVAVSPDGRWFALASAAVDDTWSVDIRPIDVRTGGVTLRSIPVDAMPTEVKALDARQVGIVVGEETRVYDVETGLRADSSKGAVATDGVLHGEETGCVDPSHRFSVEVDGSTTMTTLFRGSGPGRSVQRHLPGNRCAFDQEGRRLATWSDESGLQFVDTGTGETELVLDMPRVSAVQFLATRSYAAVTVSSDPLEGQVAASTLIVPLEPGIIELFARWLSHRALTPTECDAYALDCSSTPLSGAALLPQRH